MMKILQENPRYLIDSCGMIYDTKYNNRKTVSAILNNSKINNYNYNFEYAKEGPSTIEMVRIINSNNRVE